MYVDNATGERRLFAGALVMRDLVGKRLGDFEIVRELGRGGMGVVYEARQVSLNRQVALKVLSGGLGLTPKAVQRFRREAEAAAKLHHTNIVPVFGVGEEDGQPYYAMQYIPGLGLDIVLEELRRLNQGGTPDPEQARTRELIGSRPGAVAPDGAIPRGSPRKWEATRPLGRERLG